MIQFCKSAINSIACQHYVCGKNTCAQNTRVTQNVEQHVFSSIVIL